MITPLSPISEDPTLAAARWLAVQPEPIPHVIPALKERFGLTSLQACQAIAFARDMPSIARTPNHED